MNPFRRDSYIAVYGDSITSGFPGNTVNGEYSWLQGFGPPMRQLFAPNLAIGPRSRQMWPVWQVSASAGLSWVDYQATLPGLLETSNAPTHFIWQMGINDAVDMGPPTNETEAQLRAALLAVCGGAEARWPGVQQILIGPWNYGNPHTHGPQIALTITCMQDQAAALTPAGVFVNWNDIPMVNGVNTTDDIHPNLLGSVQLGDAVINQMQFAL